MYAVIQSILTEMGRLRNCGVEAKGGVLERSSDRHRGLERYVIDFGVLIYKIDDIIQYLTITHAYYMLQMLECI